MNAKLGIYKDCTSDNPTKVYECKRLLFGVSKKALALQNKLKDNDKIEDQFELLLDFVQLIFPEFEADEINYIDANDLIQFVNSIVQETNGELYKSQKN